MGGKQKNLRLDILKGIACICVVFLHCSFPGVVGKVIYGLARFAVPLFFAISGFYLYSEDNDATERKLPRKAKHIFEMFVGTEILYFAWHIIESSITTGGLYGALSWVAESFTINNILCFVAFQKTIIGDVSWFLVALLMCYGASYLINKLRLWNASFFLIPTMLFVNIFIGEISPFFLNLNVQWYWISNFWLLGLPCFLTGVWMKVYQERLAAISDRALYVTIICSAILNLIERVGTSASQFFISNIPFMVACMVLCLKYPSINHENKWGGYCSTLEQTFRLGSIFCTQ